MINFSCRPDSKFLLLTGMSALVLSACGGNGDTSSAPTASKAATATDTASRASIVIDGYVPNPLTPITPLTPILPGATLTKLQIVDKAAVAQSNVPVTFGQVFAKGAFPAGAGLTGLYNGAQLPLQVNVKASHPDGSVRHAVISAILPQVAAGQSTALALTVSSAAPATAPVTPGSLLASGFDTTVKLTIAGQVYTASAAQLLQSGAYTTWLAGPVANEWLVSAPLKNAAGVEHPHLAARFAIRAYSTSGKARVDVTIENNWAYEADPKNVIYDGEVLVNGQSAYRVSALEHFHHARWRKLFWTGEQPKIHVKHDSRYLIATQAVPNYDQSITVASTALTSMKTSWDAANTGPMGLALLTRAMGTTGGRPDIGLNHAWGAMYVLGMDDRAKEVTLGLSDLGGSWPIHYRDRKTGQPVSIIEYPYVRTQRVSSDSYNPVTKKHEDLPVCTATGQCAVPYSPDTSHQPSLSYVPYLVTGDAYHLDELLFWANWNLITKNPYYRSLAKGLLKGDQVRGQAWSLRSLAHAAYITPDNHPMKGYFNQILDHNLEFYNTTFAGSATNKLGFIDNTATSYAVAYAGPDGANTGVAPWMDDFFTSAVGHTYELGFTKAKPILDWKARFPVGRIMAPGYCWIDGGVYALMVRPGATAAYFNTFAEAYQATMRTSTGGVMVNSTGQRYLDQPCGSQAQADWRSQVDKDNKVWRSPWKAGEMTGYADSTTGYPSNMQPAIAMAANTGIPDAQAAWTKFINRSVKPNYGLAPQFAIVPR